MLTFFFPLSLLSPSPLLFSSFPAFLCHLRVTQNDSFIAQGASSPAAPFSHSPLTPFPPSDHIILACIQDPGIASLLKEAGVTPEAVKNAANAVRGGKQVNSKSAEEGFEALSKYAVDLTAQAESGKLDPVIGALPSSALIVVLNPVLTVFSFYPSFPGRDTEIRRCIRILSRRTKNNPCLVRLTSFLRAIPNRLADAVSPPLDR
jgi:hypothetical protein